MATEKFTHRHSDKNGNIIESEHPLGDFVYATFKGRGNLLRISGPTRTKKLSIHFDCNNAECNIGINRYFGYIRLGEECKVSIADGVTCTNPCYISTAEKASVTIGSDCMIASRNEIRADDGHPIFCVRTGLRTNMPKSITIGNHVWIAAGAAILGGTTIGDGSIVGYGSIVKGTFPNNCVLAGSPARIVRRDCAWERPHLTRAKPFFKPDESSVTKTEYWNLTNECENPDIGA